MRISILLDELDGDGIIWEDSDLTASALEKQGLSHDTNLVPLCKQEVNLLRNALVALQIIAISNCDEFMQELAEKSITLLEEKEAWITNED